MNSKTESDAVRELTSELDIIAASNGDKFRYQIYFERRLFTFTANETADEHTFVSGSGATIEDAVRAARLNISNALHEWGYK